jgi:hypothetical protein
MSSSSAVQLAPYTLPLSPATFRYGRRQCFGLLVDADDLVMLECSKLTANMRPHVSQHCPQLQRGGPRARPHLQGPSSPWCHTCPLIAVLLVKLLQKCGFVRSPRLSCSCFASHDCERRRLCYRVETTARDICNGTTAEHNATSPWVSTDRIPKAGG